MSPALLFFALMATAAPRTAGDGCSVSGSAAHEHDVSRAMQACRQARGRFAELFGAPAPRLQIVLHDSPHYEVALAGAVGLVFWPNSKALGVSEAAGPAAQAASAWEARQWQEVLPHEAMHALTMAQFYAHGDAVDTAGYGTPLPDWFEEAIGIWGEPAESRAGRLAQARLLPAEHLDLRGILGAAHPAVLTPGALAPRPGARVPPDAALRAFYPQSIAVLAYVHERGGAAAVRELARRLVRNPSDTEALAALPGLPPMMSGVVAGWHRWLAELPD
jgi:hypothetical protein